MNNYILLILLIFSFPLHSSQSGISLHLSLIARSNIPLELPLNYLLSGAFYPDSFYNCLGLSSIGEYDHWTPFLYELVKYHNQLPKQDLSLKAFIYGILNHQITDITWHSLNLHQGLLKFINNVEFDNDEDFTKSHTFIDSGGDFIILDRLLQNLSLKQREQVLDFFKTPWSTPTRHLINVYHKLGYNQINERNLNYCMLRGYTALQAEISSMVAETNPSDYYKEKSPLFVDMLDTYYLGGLQEIITTLDTCLPNLEYWFNNIDKIKDSREICNTMAGSMISSTPTRMSLEIHQNDIIFISPYIAKSYFGTSLVTGHFLGDDRDCVAISSPFEDGEGSIYIIPLAEFEAETATIKTMIKLSPSKNNKRTMTYPTRFGWQMLTFMDQFLAVSSPGSSVLKFFYKEREILQLQTPQSDNIIGETGLKQLGILLEIDDDTNDIIIGSKYAEGSHSYEEQKGQFMILNGDLILMELLQILQSSSPHSKTMNINFFIKQTLQIPLFLNQISNYENFASQFSSIHNFKAVGVENLGIVVIYEGSTPIFIINHDLKIYNYKDKNMTDKVKKTSSLQNSQFGANFVKLIEINDNVYLIIGAKSYSDSNFIQSGAGFIFAVKRNEIKLIAKISLSDKKNLDQFFHNAIIITKSSSSQTKALITSSNYNFNQGSIWELDLSSIINSYNGEVVGYQLNVDDHLIQLGPQNVGYTGFGQSLAYSNDEKLIVGMPFFGYSELFNDDLQLIGKVGIYNHI